MHLQFTHLVPPSVGLPLPDPCGREQIQVNPRGLLFSAMRNFRRFVSAAWSWCANSTSALAWDS